MSSSSSPSMTCPDFRSNFPDRFIITMCLFGLTATVVRADQIVAGGTNYLGVRIAALEQGRLLFRTADGTSRTAWIDDIELLIVDRGGVFADLNQAERYFAAGEPQRAIARYRRTLRLVEGLWPDLINARLLLACDAAGQLDDATLNFIRVLRGGSTGPPAATRLIPRTMPAKRDAKVVRSLERTNAALAQDPDDPQRALLQLLRYEILRRTGDRVALAAALTVAATPIPESARSERAYAILLPAMREAFQSEVGPEALPVLDLAIRDCPDTALPGFLLLKGRTLLQAAATRDEIIRAAWPFFRVSIHFPDDQRAPEGLYLAALAVERIGLRNRAIELLAGCLAHGRLTVEIRQLAEEEMQRLKSTGTKSG